ncbi:MAG: hypothetical protein ACOZDD_05065 [Bacteroidota bacterium]|mgnify:CR=1 FL=1
MEKHVNVVAALFIGLSIFGLVIALFAAVILGLVGGFVDDPVASKVLPIIASVIIWIMIIFSLPGIVAGVGLFRRKEWARILTLILSVIKLLNVPVGTAVGIYSIWVLVQDETVALFKPPFEKKEVHLT